MLRLVKELPLSLRTGTIGLVAIAIFAGILHSWHARTPEGYRFTGFTQGDMPTYVANARTIARSPSGILYANPYDLRERPAYIYLQLPVTLLGWLLRAGLPPFLAFEPIRFVFGVSMYVALGMVLRRLFGRGRWFWTAFAITGFGGGLAWLLSAIPSPPATTYAQRVMWHEREYYWWFLDLFRNVMYPFELVYHALLLGQVVALQARRWRAANALLLLGALSNPFLGLQMLGLQCGAAAWAWRESARARWVALAIGCGLALYYAVLLPLDPVAAGIRRQHLEALTAPLGLRSLAVGHGLGLAGIGAFLLHRSFRREVLRDWNFAPVIVLAGWTLLLSQNSRIPGLPDVQPMHFTRGYLFVGSWILTLAWLRRFAVPRWALPLLIVLTLPDNAMFARNQWVIPPKIPELVLDPGRAAVVEFFAKQPAGRCAGCLDTALSLHISTMPRHRSLLGLPPVTPDYAERRSWLAKTLESPAVETHGVFARVDALIVRREPGGGPPRVLENPRWKEVARNAEWSVIFRSEPAR